jgi:hypothetical protein
MDADGDMTYKTALLLRRTGMPDKYDIMSYRSGSVTFNLFSSSLPIIVASARSFKGCKALLNSGYFGPSFNQNAAKVTLDRLMPIQGRSDRKTSRHALFLVVRVHQRRVQP